MLLIKPKINFPMMSSFSINKSDFSFSTKPSSQLRRSNVSSSVSEPNAMCKNCINSFGLFLAEPSAMLTGTDTAARRIWDIKPYRSSFGNELVASYSYFTSSKLLIQQFNFLCGFISNFILKLPKTFCISHTAFYMNHLTFYK